MQPLIEVRNITKHFGGLHALKGVSLSVGAGEVVALAGHNGAGKSVLVQIFSGVFQPSSGEIVLDGAETVFHAPTDARKAGVETIFQTLALADNLDATANFFLGRELRDQWGFLDKKCMRKEAHAALIALNPNFTDIDRPVREMSGGQRQAIAIARAIHFNVRLLIMDEPTAALGPHETAQVANVILHLRSRNIGILLISHDMRDVLRLADRVVVLKNGEVVGSGDTTAITEDQIVEMIIRGKPETVSV